MYLSFFNFSGEPFSIAPNPQYIYMSERHQEGLGHLLYGLNKGGGFVVLTGEVGTGKTTLCHCLFQHWPEDIDVALVLNPKLSAVELLATICDELQISYDEMFPTFKGLVDRLNEHLLATHAKGRRTVLLIDEAQNLSLDVLEQIRLLTNLETGQTKLLQIVLVGQPELKVLLSRPELRQLNQRITARYHLLPLTRSETEKYIRYRIWVNGGDPKIFNKWAIRQVYKLSKGVPRLINIICDRALLGAYVSGHATVTAKIVKKAAKEIFCLERQAKALTHKTLLVFSIVVAAVIVIYPKMTDYIDPGKVGVLINALKQPDEPSKAVETVQPVVKAEPEPETEPVVKKASEVVVTAPVTGEVSETIEPEPEIVKVMDFNAFVTEQGVIDINDKIPDLAKYWQVTVNSEDGCDGLENSGLACFFDQTKWKDLLLLQRPVILELSLSETEKRYVLFTGVKSGKAVFKGKNPESFSSEEVLSLWQGYYLMLWHPPVANIKLLKEGQISEAVVWVRKQLNPDWNDTLITPSSIVFDSALKEQVIEFQKKHQLMSDGIIGPRTFVQLEKNNSQSALPILDLDN